MVNSYLMSQENNLYKEFDIILVNYPFFLRN